MEHVALMTVTRIPPCLKAISHQSLKAKACCFFNPRWKTIPVVFLRCPISAVQEQCALANVQCNKRIAGSSKQQALL